MNILKRIINAYKSGGVKEIIRKTAFHYVYRFNNRITKMKVDNATLEYGLYESDERQRKIIISLTSFPSRFKGIHICLKSLLLQSIKPDKIIVYLGCDSSEEMLTNEMKELMKYGIEYRFDYELNLLAHKKYFYAMQEYPNDIIVTADDDLYYPNNWLESLIKSYQKYPDAISARRVHLMKIEKGIICNYNSWEDQCRRKREPSFDLFGTGGSGKLYPPGCLKKCTFDVDAIIKLSLTADDVWLKCMEVLSGVKVVWVKSNEVDQISVENKQEIALSNKNVDLCQNDILLKNVMNAYGIESQDFFV